MSNPAIRLVCLHHAGGSVSAFHAWKGKIPDDIELCPIALPGHDARYNEPFCTDLVHIAESMAQTIANLPAAQRLVLFGHSMGAIIALELAYKLNQKHIVPDLLVLSGRAAPHHYAGVSERLHLLPDEQFIAQLRSWYGGIPKTILDNRELLDIYLPILRADLQAVETYQYKKQPPAEWPLMIYSGKEDARVACHDLTEWQRYTNGPFRLHWFDGGHFYYQQDTLPFIQKLVRDIYQWSALFP